VVGHLVEGDFFGEIGLLLGTSRTATVRAGSDGVHALVLAADGFRVMMKESNLAHEEIAQVMRNRLN
jgi:CRP-like cAMP-binding protein